MGEIALRPALEEYKTVYMPARNLAARTRIEYTHDLENFIDYLERSSINRVGELQIPHIDRYLAELDARGLSGATRKRMAITIRSFLAFLFRNSYLSNDLSSRIIIPFPEQVIPRILTQAEYTRLLYVCSSSIRDTAIITLLLQTGIRLSELTRLTLSNAEIGSSGKGKLLVISSGSRKGRLIPLNAKASQALEAYLETRSSTKYQILFINYQGKPMGARGIQKRIMKYYQLAKIPGASVHSLRHTFGVQHIAKGTSLKTVQEVMGHQDIRTTEAYIPMANEISRKEIEDNAL
jgi:site-specific recombinase XerD